MNRASSPTLFAGLLMLALGGVAQAVPPGAMPKVKHDTKTLVASKSDRKPSSTRSTEKCGTTKSTKSRKSSPEPGYVVLQLDSDVISPGSDIAIVRISPCKRTGKA